MGSTDLAASAGHSASPFDVELQKFLGGCQVHAATAAQGPSALRDLAGRLADALPRPRTCAEFLVLRSILVEFGARALQAAGVERPSAVILPLVLLQPPHGELGATFVRCMRASVLPRNVSAVRIADLRVGRAMAVITARLADPGLSAASVAAAIGVSESYFAKLLHAHCGCGFRTVVRRARLEAARDRLEHSLDRVKEVAARVGYSSTSQLDRDFVRTYNLTPGQHRRQQHELMGPQTVVSLPMRRGGVETS